MPKISQMSRLLSINKNIKGLKKDIQTAHDSMKGFKKSKTLIHLEKHINKAIKGFRTISRSTKGRTHNRIKKHKTSLNISSHNVEDNICNKSLAPFESVDIPYDSRGIAQDRSLTVTNFGFPNSSESAVGYTPHVRGKDFFPSDKMSVKSSSPDAESIPVNEDDIRFCNFGILPTKRRSGLPPSTTPDIPIEKIVRAYVSGGFYMRIKKAVMARKGLDGYGNDSYSKNRLINLENMIHRSACFYIAAKILPPDWKYDPSVAYTLA